jgi:phage terminase large subunit-like protein
MSKTAEKYIDDVLSGRIVAGQLIVKAFQRHKKDLIDGAKRGLWFDPEAGDYVIEFCETYCIPSAMSEPMTLMPWQQAFIYILYGWKRADGSRRFRRAYLEIAKKNGKTGLAAALSLYHLTTDNEMSGRVFVAATALKQARECFLEAVAMRDKSEELRGIVEKYGKSPVLSLYVPDTNSRLSPMTRGSDSQDGAVVSAAILDELHRWKLTDNLWSILRYGGDNRTQPMLICITTAGANANKSTLCWGEREYGVKILEGFIDDDEVCPFIFALDPIDLKDNGWKDEKNWIKANPSIGDILPLSALQNQFREAQGKPTAMGEYKRYRLNIWTDEVSDPAIEIENWDECVREDIARHPDNKRLRKQSLEELKGRLCFAGLDLAPTKDTSALVLVFPPLKVGEKWRVIPWFWCPKDNVDDRVSRDHVPYDTWAGDGFIELTPGDLTDVRFICDQIVEINKMFNLKEIAYDKSWSSELIRMLIEAGFPMEKTIPHGQKHDRMNPPCQELMRKILRKEFAHDNDPVLRWQMSNLRWNVEKNSGFVRPARDRKREKIDGCVSLIMALGRATDPENVIKPKREFFVVTSK